MSNTSQTLVSVVHPSGLLAVTEDFRARRQLEMREKGFEAKHFEPENSSENGFTSGTALERALLLSQALTDRKSSVLWAARGGFGASELIDFLERMLPPVLPSKTLVGFSDVSFLGTYLSCRYPNFRYIHANNFYDPRLFRPGAEWEKQILFDILGGRPPKPIAMPLEWKSFSVGLEAHRDFPESLSGECVPLNFALAGVLSSLPRFRLEQPHVLFLEDINERTYQLLRLADQVHFSKLFPKAQAIILGEFEQCLDWEGKELSPAALGDLLSKKLRLPVFGMSAFGHGKNRLPLVFGSRSLIDVKNMQLHIQFDSKRPAEAVSLGTPLDPSSTKQSKQLKVHFVGIGGTGMASVAGLAKAQGHLVSGSDNPIYPPMDQTLRELEIVPEVGFSAENLIRNMPDEVVLANVISRRNAELKPNLEFQALTQSNFPVYSFPSFLNRRFLEGSCNVVVAGTHGKTTTTSLLAHLFKSAGLNPSFMVGGRPKNFGVGFALQNPNLFVLEGDEYDSALFDKGPKFLHYAPTVALINNIEFDHADIYANVEAIQQEFYRYALLCSSLGGVVVANETCHRSVDCALRARKESACPTILFGKEGAAKSPNEPPKWTLVSFQPSQSGLVLKVKAPFGEVFEAPVGLFGPHNALNAVASLACAHAHSLFEMARSGHLQRDKFESFARDPKSFPKAASYLAALGTFEGVERRFECVGHQNGIWVYDDFAHHPTAIDTTLKGFRDHLSSLGSKGRLIACFDPRNATMRRRVLQKELTESFANADLVRFGKLPIDKRLAVEEMLDPKSVAQSIGPKAKCFDDNEELLKTLAAEVKAGDMVVFMSSGAFDGAPRNFLKLI